jgi:hypothetical protein
MKNFTTDFYIWNTKISLWGMVFDTLWIVLLASLMSACDDFVEVDLPNSQLTAHTVFEEKATANAAMTDIYSKIRDAGLLTGSANGLSHLLGNYAYELDFYGVPQNSAVAFYHNSLIASNPDVKSLWDNSYNQIYATNAVIEGVELSVHLQEGDRDQLQGEALFLRALLHFYLTNLYGAIPYITTTDYQQNSRAKKLTVDAVYSKCKDDLELALLVLPKNNKSNYRVRPNAYAANALLARIDLYAGLWDEASDEASAVLNNTELYAIEQDLKKTFLKESTETIWQLAPAFDNGNTLESGTFNFTIGPPPLSALTTDLMEAFSVDDLRKQYWTEAVTDGTATWYHSFKYKYFDIGSSMEYSIIFRLSEMYLIRAEARAHSGDLIGAKEDLNIIRNKAGLSDTNAITQEGIIEAVLHERQLELFTEFGHRFFDLKRSDKLQSVLSAVKPGWDAHDILFPLPETELNLNPNMQPQNTGY